ncbi:hypothetical protein [Clostridium butyricum]|nr:hypothetical protein [Clostridium butyricum]
MNRYQREINKKAKLIMWNFGEFNLFFKQSFYKVRKNLRKEFNNK